MDVLKIWCEAAPPDGRIHHLSLCRQDIPDALVDEVVLGEDPEKLSFGVLASQHDSPTTGIGITCRHSGLSSPNLDFGWIIRAAVHAKAKELTETQWKDKAIQNRQPKAGEFRLENGRREQRRRLPHHQNGTTRIDYGRKPAKRGAQYAPRAGRTLNRFAQHS